MALPGAYAQYNNSKVLTASPAELTLMLYDGAIKFCNIAEMAVENIIGYLHSTLDMKYEVSKDFDNIYTYLERRLVEANVKKDKEILEEINTHLHAIRDNWKEVMKAGAKKGND